MLYPVMTVIENDDRETSYRKLEQIQIRLKVHFDIYDDHLRAEMTDAWNKGQAFPNAKQFGELNDFLEKVKEITKVTSFVRSAVKGTSYITLCIAKKDAKGIALVQLKELVASYNEKEENQEGNT